ncbi:coagulation factor XII [Galendromus occidentalis]|uniref:Coagulation factor XII n=1 Tax=Galendromus occidentalis TaxID=34638 RepID=A0AAJ6VZY7_9ACAR|nr:coagulation factor XII [Galendromus occidentalis]
MEKCIVIFAVLVSALCDDGGLTGTSKTTMRSATSGAPLNFTSIALNFTLDANSTGPEEIESRSLTPVRSSASQGCRSYQGGVGRCVPYSECSASFENEFIARSSLCGFSNRRPLVCCPHDTYGFGNSLFQPFLPGFQQNFFQQNPFANSFFYNPVRSFYQQPAYSNAGFGFQQPSPFGFNNNGFGGGGGFNNYGNDAYAFRPGFRKPAYSPAFLGLPEYLSAHIPSNNNRFQNGYAGGHPPSEYVQPRPTSPPTYVGQLPVQNTNQFGLPNLRPPSRNEGAGSNFNGGGGSGLNLNRPSGSDRLLNSRYCGLTNSTSKRIVGGREAAVGAWPWLALLFVDVSGNGYKAPLCGGALISPRHVLTAAHCVNLMGKVLPANRFTVRLGEHDYLATDDGANPVDIDVNRVNSHPNFNNRTYFNDIAILSLRRAVSYGQGVAPICVPDTAGDDSEYKGRSANVAGWGELYYAGPASSVLQETTLPLQSLDTCKEAFKRTVIRFNDNYLCAGSLQGDRDTCRGDSGGPLMLLNEKGRYTVIGVTSFGRRCAEKGYPGSYTRVAKYSDWIQTVLNSS